MSRGRFPLMDLKGAYDVEQVSSTSSMIEDDFWPLDAIDPEKSKFPCCLVWNPLPVVSWLAPFIGHVGICREDGVVLDFSGSYSVNVDDFAFGSSARYLPLDRTQCCLPANLAGHKCKYGFKHTEFGSAITWDDALSTSRRSFEHRSYNMFTCNSHSFVANCLNRVCYGGSMEWNMVNVAALIMTKGKWVGPISIIRSFLPCLGVATLGISLVGWQFLVGLFSFSLLLAAWFIIGSCCFNHLLEC